MDPFTTSFCAMMAVRAVSGIVSKVGEYVFPYEGSKDWQRQDQAHQNAKELERMREQFSFEMQKRNEQLQIGLANYNRQTSLLLAKYNTVFSLKHTLIQDAIRNFPLNISPLVLLENNGIDVNFLLDGSPLTKESGEAIAKQIETSTESARPLSVFITPMHVDSRVNGKEAIASQVYDSIYSSIETVFVNEYSRNSCRPVIFYPTAWNKNVKGGLHASEELYYFLKDLPTLVIEPRYDGSKLKVMFSCWGLGYSVRKHFRQEMSIDIDWNSLLVPHIYERSKKAIETMSNLDMNNRFVKDQVSMCKHNVEMYEKLNLAERIPTRLKEIAETGHSNILNELGDLSKMFFSTSIDIQELSTMLASSIGYTIAGISDVHHLLASDVEPRLPYIFNQYFKNITSRELLKGFSEMYQQTYYRLEAEYPDNKDKKEIQLNGIKQLLLGADYVDEKEISSSLDILRNKCIELKCDRHLLLNWNAQQCLRYILDEIQEYDSYFMDWLFKNTKDPMLRTEIQATILRLKENY